MLCGYVPYFLFRGSRLSYKHIKIWSVIVYIINGSVTRNNFDDRSYRVYFMIYAATIEVILYWNPDQRFVIQRYHHVWFVEYNSRLSIEDNHTPGSLILQQYHKSLIHNSDLLNLITCEIGLTSTPFCDTTILKYDIEFTPAVKKLVLTY